MLKARPTFSDPRLRQPARAALQIIVTALLLAAAAAAAAAEERQVDDDAETRLERLEPRRRIVSQRF